MFSSDSFAQAQNLRSATLRCSVVIVGFHASGKIDRCLRMLQKRTGSIPLEIIVVNNSMVDRDEVGALCSKFQAAFIQNESNLGYARACNLGARSASGSVVLFLNPEVVISYESLRLLVGLAEAHPSLVAIGPLQGMLNGKVRGRRRVVGQPRSSATSTLRKLGAPGAIAATSFLPSGAMMARKDALIAVGGFDEQLFLNHEDDDLCLRLARIGPLAYAAGVLAVHDPDKSMPASPEVTYAKAWHLGFSRVQVLKKHYGKWASFSPLGKALTNFLSLRILTARGRKNATAFLSGCLSAHRNPERAKEVVPT